MISVRDVTVYATVWAAENKGSYGQARFTTSRKDKQTDEYKNSNWSFVNFVGSAALEEFDDIVEQLEDEPKKGVRIIIKSFSLSNEPYENEDGEKVYPKSPRMVVWDWEYNTESNRQSAPTRSRMDTPPAVTEGKKNKSTPKTASKKSKPADETPFDDSDDEWND